jgi:hypothetical protein
MLVGFRGVRFLTTAKPRARTYRTSETLRADPRSYQDRLVEFISTQDTVLEYSEEIAPARGMSQGGRITLLPGMAPAETFATLVHECAHELLHRQKNRAQLSKRQRQTEAEAVAFVVCHAIGLETGTACQNYIQLYQGDATVLLESLENIRSAASRILDGILTVAA